MSGISSRLELRHLRYFVAVAEELHFGRAARRLGIAQPPLSQQIAAIEKLFGAMLFDRSGRRVRLTPAGKALVGGAGKILALSAHLPAVVTAAARGEVGTLSVGVAASASLSVVPPALRAFRTEFPAVQILLREGVTDDHMSDVETGVLDLALIRGPISRPGLTVDTIRREAILLAIPSGHPLESKPKVRWQDLGGVDAVMFPRAAAPPLFDTIIAQCSAAGVTLRIVHEASEWPTVSALVAAGAGVGFATESAAHAHQDDITFRAFEGRPAVAELIAVSRTDNESPALRGFVAIAARPVDAVRGSLSARSR